jgi:transcriptional regulator with XRE-family HTH domain
MEPSKQPKLAKSARLVGGFIRQRREALGLSQRALGLLFDPPVTTQFISNVERGVTPLPPVHIPTLTRALLVAESELTGLLEKEFALKLSGRVGLPGAAGEARSQQDTTQLIVAPGDADLMRSLYDAYRHSDEKTRQAFLTVCESMLKLPKRPGSQTPIPE